MPALENIPELCPYILLLLSAFFQEHAVEGMFLLNGTKLTQKEYQNSPNLVYLVRPSVSIIPLLAEQVGDQCAHSRVRPLACTPTHSLPSVRCRKRGRCTPFLFDAALGVPCWRKLTRLILLSLFTLISGQGGPLQAALRFLRAPGDDLLQPTPEELRRQGIYRCYTSVTHLLELACIGMPSCPSFLSVSLTEAAPVSELWVPARLSPLLCLWLPLRAPFRSSNLDWFWTPIEPDVISLEFEGSFKEAVLVCPPPPSPPPLLPSPAFPFPFTPLFIHVATNLATMSRISPPPPLPPTFVLPSLRPHNRRHSPPDDANCISTAGTGHLVTSPHCAGTALATSHARTSDAAHRRKRRVRRGLQGKMPRLCVLALCSSRSAALAPLFVHVLTLALTPRPR